MRKIGASNCNSQHAAQRQVEVRPLLVQEDNTSGREGDCKPTSATAAAAASAAVAAVIMCLQLPSLRPQPLPLQLLLLLLLLLPH